MEIKGNIRVCVRVRKLISRETKGYVSVNHLMDWINVNTDSQEIVVHNKNNNMNSKFEYDWVFDQNTTQIEVFEEIKPLVISSLDGYNCCIMAYGQTGSGKTFTMEGSTKNIGVCLRSFEELFIEITERTEWTYELTMSIMEVYNERLRDLLSNNENEDNIDIQYDKKNNL